MALDLTPGSLIRSGSYLLVAFIGIVLLVRRHHHPWNSRLGAIFVLSGASGTLFNVVGGHLDPDPVDATWGPPGLVLTSALSLVQAGLWLSIGLPLLRELPTRIRIVIVCAMSGLSLWTIPYAKDVVEGGWTDAAVVADHLDSLTYAPLIAIYGVLLMVAAEHARRPGPRRTLLWLVILPGAVDPAIYAGENLAQMASSLGAPRAPPLSVHQAILFSEPVLYSGLLLWELRAAAGPYGRSAVGLTLGMLAVVLVAQVVTATTEGGMQGTGVGGILLIAAALLAFQGIVREGLLGRAPQGRLASPTTLAAIGLASLFITAQVLQNFLSDALGLLGGGIVAGAAVFAAYPLQRVAERALERGKTVAADEAPEKYRRLVETAWTDGRLGANERLLLAESRRQLGLDAETALAIDEEVARRKAHATRS